MDAVQALADVTKELYELVQETKKVEDRGELISQIEVLLDKREQLLSKITPPFTPEQELMGKQMIEMNRVINSELKKIMVQVQMDLQGLKKKKTSIQKYVNPYQSLESDGIYYDKKK
jgi:flagellar protein FliT